MAQAQRQWHRLFGVAWADYLTGEPFHVEMEVDLSLRSQFLDVVILRRDSSDTPMTVAMPDGFDDLAQYNLISFKSFREPLSPFAIEELIAHYVNYRKQISLEMDDPLPAEQFRLFAVGVRAPDWLPHDRVERIRAGVYRYRILTRDITLVIVHELPLEVQNARLHLFSALDRGIRFGRANCEIQSEQTTSFLRQLWQVYQGEGFVMPYTMEQFMQEARRDMLNDPVSRRIILEGIPEEERVAGVSTEQLLRQLLSRVSVEELRQAIPADLRATLDQTGNDQPEGDPPPTT